MKKLILSVGMALTFNNAFGQWVNKFVDNGFDEPYKICYNSAKNDDDVLAKLEFADYDGSGRIIFYIQGGYFCGETIKADISFLVNGVYEKYSTNGDVASDHESLFLIHDLRNDIILENFKKASMMKIRINDDICGEEIYTFSMTGSTSAYNYVLNQ